MAPPQTSTLRAGVIKLPPSVQAKMIAMAARNAAELANACEPAAPTRKEPPIAAKEHTLANTSYNVIQNPKTISTASRRNRPIFDLPYLDSSLNVLFLTGQTINMHRHDSLSIVEVLWAFEHRKVIAATAKYSVAAKDRTDDQKENVDFTVKQKLAIPKIIVKTPANPGLKSILNHNHKAYPSFQTTYNAYGKKVVLPRSALQPSAPGRNRRVTFAVPI
ncbi:hypothetical protein BT69DRAFT_1281435, partial [Atractiella rhizophila]